jgi:hypothetical protein
VTIVYFLCVPILFVMYMSIGDTMLRSLKQIDIRPAAVKTLLFALAGVVWSTFLFFMIASDPIRAFLVLGAGDPLFPVNGVPSVIALTLLLLIVERLTYRYIQCHPPAAAPLDMSKK